MDNRIELRARLMRRIVRLHKTAVDVGAVNALVESAAYHVLESEISRPHAIWRYIRHAIRLQSYRARDGFTYYRRYYWFRYVKFLPPDKIVEKLDSQMMSEIEQIYGPTFIEDMAKIAREEKGDE
jgi:hypothetical protein